MRFGCCRCSALDGSFVRVMAVPLTASLGMVAVIGSVKSIVGQDSRDSDAGGRRRGELCRVPADPRRYVHGLPNPRHDSRHFHHSPGAACRVMVECAGRRWHLAGKTECQARRHRRDVRGRPAPRGASATPAGESCLLETRRVRPRGSDRNVLHLVSSHGVSGVNSNLRLVARNLRTWGWQPHDVSLPAGQYRPEAFYRRRNTGEPDSYVAGLVGMPSDSMGHRPRQTRPAGIAPGPGSRPQFRRRSHCAESLRGDLRFPSLLPARATRISTGPSAIRFIIGDGRAHSEPWCRSPDRWRKT